MAAAKSMLGHAETGAGAVGIAQAALQLQQHSQLPMTHLRLLNPYVQSALEAEAKLMRTSGAQARYVSKTDAISKQLPILSHLVGDLDPLSECS